MHNRKDKRGNVAAGLWDSRPTIGLLSEMGGSPYHHALWEGVAAAASDLDVNLICYMGGVINPSEHNFLYDLVSGDRVDGLLICGTIGSLISLDEFRSFLDRYRPLPMVGITQTPGLPSVIVDNEKGMRDLVTHLIEVHGCRRIAFIGGPEGNQEAALRYRAYTATLTEHGLPLDPDLVVSGDFVYGTGVEAIRLLLDERQARFEAVVAANDWMAFGALKALGERGVRVPEDVVLTGFDDTPEASASSPSLTTVRQSIHQLGRAGLELLLKILTGEQVPEQTLLPTRLMVRQSCGCSEPTVAHAVVGLRRAKKKPLPEAIAARREAILAQMAQAMGEPASPPPAWAGRLLDSFLEEITSGPATGGPGAGLIPQSPFLSVLDDLLRQAIAPGDRVEDWQEVVSVMRRHLLPHLTGALAMTRAEDLFGQGRVLIGQVAQWHWASRKLEETRRTVTLNYLASDLVAAVEMEPMLEALAHRIPELGFPGFYLALYDDLERPAAWSRLLLACGQEGRLQVGEEGSRFPSCRLMPDDLWPRGRRYSLLVEALRREEQLGFVLFEMGPREGTVYETLQGHLSSALKAALLAQQRERHTLQLQTAAEVSRAVVSILDPDELARQVVDLVRERFGLYYVGLFLVDDSGEWAELRAGSGEAGRKMVEQGHRLAVGGESMIGWCTANAQARVAQRADEDAIRLPNPLLPDTRSEMALPLIARGQVLGAMTIQSEKEAAFSEEDIAALQTMADQVATAIANARLYKALAQEQYLMQALMDTIPDHIYFKDMQSRFIRVSSSLVEWFGLDDPAQMLGKTDFDFFTEDHARLAYETEQEIIRTGQPMVGVEEKETWPDRPDTWVLTSKLPLRDEQGKIVGTFGISSDITARKRMEETLERRAMQLQTAAEVSHAAVSILDPDELARQVVDLVHERFGLYYVGLFLVDDSGEWAELRAGSGEAGRKMVEQGHRLAVGGESMIGWCTANAQARVAQRADEDTIRLPNPLLPDTRSEMALPLIARGQVLGAMTIQSEKEAAFSEEDIAALQTMADQVATAIANARLFEQMRAALAEVEATQRRYLQQAWTEYRRLARVSAYETGRPGTTPLGDRVLPEVRQAIHRRETTVLSEDGGETSALVVPVTLRGQPIAALGIHDEGSRRQWTEEEIALAEAVAERMALTAESLRLLDEVQRRAARDRFVGEVTSRLGELLNVDRVLQTAVREIGESLGLHDLVIQLETDTRSVHPADL